MKGTIRFGLLLGAMGLIFGSAHQALAASAIWGEEMSAAPGPQWGGWDDVDGSMAGLINVVSDPENASNSVWKIPQGAGSGAPPGNGGSDFGIAVINPLTGQPDPPTDGLDQFTVEFRYRINTDTGYPNEAVGIYQTYPVAVTVGHAYSPALRYLEGYVALGASTEAGYANIETQTAEGGIFGGSPGTFMCEPVNPPAWGEAGETDRQQWQTVRMVQDNLAKTQKTYLNGVLITEHDTITYFDGTGTYPAPTSFTRSLAIFQAQQFTEALLDQWTYVEVMYDYVRVADGLVDINEAIGPVPEPASGLMALVLWGLGLIARRRS